MFLIKGRFPVSRNIYVRTCVKFTFANETDALHERPLLRVKVEPCSTSRLSSALFLLLLFYLRALTCVAKTASVEINLKLSARSTLKKNYLRCLPSLIPTLIFHSGGDQGKSLSKRLPLY